MLFHIPKTNHLFPSVLLKVWTNRKYAAIWKDWSTHQKLQTELMDRETTTRLLRVYNLDFFSIFIMVGFCLSKAQRVCTARIYVPQNHYQGGCCMPSAMAQSSTLLIGRQHLLRLQLSLSASQDRGCPWGCLQVSETDFCYYKCFHLQSRILFRLFNPVLPDSIKRLQ